jgi:hypothetical protein
MFRLFLSEKLRIDNGELRIFSINASVRNHFSILHSQLIFAVMLAVLLSCTDAERDNPDDPVNRKSSSSEEQGGSSSSSSETQSSSSEVSYPTLQDGVSDVSRAITFRYWDACKPSCAEPSFNGNANEVAKSCNVLGSGYPSGSSLTSACSGGSAYACMYQAPWKVNDNVSYGFAAHKGSCGKCYQLQFTSDGKGSSNTIIGKTMIVMIIDDNSWNSASGNQFYIMIPGGGADSYLYNALSNQVQQNHGNTKYLNENKGDFAADCSGDGGCVKHKCSTTFSSPGLADLKAGCDWFVDWFKIADNPEALYKEITCPQELVDKYR